MKIAVVGMSDSAKEAPFNTDWKVWGLPWHREFWPRFDRHFEMHELSLIREHPEVRPKDYEERLKTLPDLYMQEAYKYIPNAKQYPFHICNYYNSSIAYMLAMAIYQKPDTIGLWGVDMKAGEEFFYQRPNCEYLLGMAIGNGIEVVVHDSSPLCKFDGNNIPYGVHKVTYQGRYGCRSQPIQN